MKNLLNIMTKEINISILILIVGAVVYCISKQIIKKIIINDDKNMQNHKKRKTYLRLFNNILKYLLLVVVTLLILQVNGVNVNSIIASLGLISVIVGFALQDALKDIIMGINIVIDNYFSVGDVLKIEDVEGKVLEIGLKTTRMKDVNNGNIFVVSNRNISKSLNISQQLDIDIPLPYEEKIMNMEEIIQVIIAKIQSLEKVKNVEYKGINEFGNSAIYYKIRIYCPPEFRMQIKRDANRIIKLELDENNISIPYQQIDIHSK